MRRDQIRIGEVYVAGNRKKVTQGFGGRAVVPLALGKFSNYRSVCGAAVVENALADDSYLCAAIHDEGHGATIVTDPRSAITHRHDRDRVVNDAVRAIHLPARTLRGGPAGPYELTRRDQCADLRPVWEPVVLKASQIHLSADQYTFLANMHHDLVLETEAAEQALAVADSAANEAISNLEKILKRKYDIHVFNDGSRGVRASLSLDILIDLLTTANVTGIKTAVEKVRKTNEALAAANTRRTKVTSCR